MPWSDAMSLTRVAPEGTGCANAVTTLTSAMPIAAPGLENLVEDTDQPPRFQVVFHEAASEVPDAELSHRGRQHHVARRDVGDAHDARQHDDLAIAVDLDFADTFDH